MKLSMKFSQTGILNHIRMSKFEIFRTTCFWSICQIGFIRSIRTWSCWKLEDPIKSAALWRHTIHSLEYVCNDHKSKKISATELRLVGAACELQLVIPFMWIPLTLTFLDDQREINSKKNLWNQLYSVAFCHFLRLSPSTLHVTMKIFHRNLLIFFFLSLRCVWDKMKCWDLRQLDETLDQLVALKFIY